MVLRAAGMYFGIVFAVAFGLGVLRVLLVAPLVGPTLAVALEVPVVLALSWVVAGWVLRRWPVARSQRLTMGTLAFGMLIAAEAGLAAALSGQSTLTFFASMATSAGTLGLVGQIGFAILPALRR